jgi:XTP/dITP diphosphohydrolase
MSRKKTSNMTELLRVMAVLRSPEGCPWDREQDHRSLRFHAVEEVYELMDAIEAGDDTEMAEELGDLLLQVVFHSQLASERGAFDFEGVAGKIVEKLIRRHPHVFGEAKAETVEAVWRQWDRIKKAEKQGTVMERTSALDGIPRHLPALLRAEKLAKKARKAGLMALAKAGSPASGARRILGRRLFRLAATAQARGLSAEELLREETNAFEKKLRQLESKRKGLHQARNSLP